MAAVKTGRINLLIRKRFGHFSKEASMPVYRIRWCHGNEGGSNHYSHADVIAPRGSLALRAAEEGRVFNWRWIDAFDRASKDYSEYELLYRVDVVREAREPAKPAPPRHYTTLNGKKLNLYELTNPRYRKLLQRMHRLYKSNTNYYEFLNAINSGRVLLEMYGKAALIWQILSDLATRLAIQQGCWYIGKNANGERRKFFKTRLEKTRFENAGSLDSFLRKL